MRSSSKTNDRGGRKVGAKWGKKTKGMKEQCLEGIWQEEDEEEVEE